MKTDKQTVNADRLARLRSEQDHQVLLSRVASLAAENESLRTRLKDIEHNQQEESRRTLRLAEYIIENSPAILFRRLAADDLKDRKMVYVSPNISRFGYRAEDLLSNRIMFRDFVYPGDNQRVAQEIAEFVRQGREHYTQYYRIVTRDGEIRWVEDRTSVVEDESGIRYHQGIVMDIHKRKEAEERLKKSEEKYRQIVDTTGEGFVLMDDKLRILDHNSAFAEMLGRSQGELIGTSPLADIAEARELLLSGQTNPTRPSRYLKIECELPLAEGLPLPVLIHANTLHSDSSGVIGIMAFISDMTEQKKALSLAGEVQRSLLPANPPDIAGFDIAGRNRACEEVGGDYYDYLVEPGNVGGFSIVVGDITGHGVDSALLMSSARGFLRMRASQPGSMVDVISSMNRHLTEDVQHTGRFMTLFYLSFDRGQNRARWIRAGHDPGLLYDPADDHFVQLKGPGLALGVDADYPYEMQSTPELKAGQIIVIFTDGLWEACNGLNEMYGRHRLQACIREHLRKNEESTAERILEAILDDQSVFCEDKRIEDDITLVVVKILHND